MFFDMHSDILYDIVRKRTKNQRNIIKDQHLKQLLNGNILGGIWNYYTDAAKPLCEFNCALEYILEELEQAKDYIHIAKNKEDLKSNKINVVLGFESLQPIKDENHLKQMYEIGFRHAMLTWNEQNQFATGVLGDVERGLTPEGEKIIQFMNNKPMILDVSHANKKTFAEIIKYSQKPVIASHSNVANLCPHKRNLDNKQITKLMDQGGLMGITSIKSFVSKEEPTVKGMANHIDYLKNLNLINQIGIGFDFTDYLKGPGEKNSNLEDMSSTSYTNNLIEELITRNYTEEEINKISHKNALQIINQLL